VITIDIRAMAKQHERGLITSREYAQEVWRQLVDRMPYLAIVDATTVLVDVAGLPREVVEAFHRVEPRELAEQLRDSIPALADGETHIVPLRPMLALLIYRVAADERSPHFAGKIVNAAGRPIPGTDESVQPWTGPWFAHHPATLIAHAIDDTANLDALERTLASRTNALERMLTSRTNALVRNPDIQD